MKKPRPAISGRIVRNSIRRFDRAFISVPRASVPINRKLITAGAALLHRFRKCLLNMELIDRRAGRTALSLISRYRQFPLVTLEAIVWRISLMLMKNLICAIVYLPLLLITSTLRRIGNASRNAAGNWPEILVTTRGDSRTNESKRPSRSSLCNNVAFTSVRYLRAVKRVRCKAIIKRRIIN